VKTNHRRVIKVDSSGVEWYTFPGENYRSHQEFSLQESLDGSTVYDNGMVRLKALDPATGRTRWALDFPGGIAAPPVQDGKGNLIVLSGDRKVRVLSADGRVERSWEIDADIATVNTTRPRLAIDNQGNICMTPNPGEFSVYSPEGRKVITVTPDSLFPGTYIEDFVLSRDGSSAFVVAGAFGIAEVSLPGSARQKAEQLMDELGEDSGENPASVVIEEEDYIEIDGVKLPRKSALLQGAAIP